MRFVTILGLALRRLRRRPIRSFLLLQGTVWGVAVAVFPAAVIEGTRQAAVLRGASLGADRINLTADPTSARGEKLRRSDMEALAGEIEAPVRALGAVRILRTPGSDEPRGITALFATPRAAEARGLELVDGRWFGPGETGVCVVEAGLAFEIGSTLEVPWYPDEMEIVGRTKARSLLVRNTNDLGFDVRHPLYKKLTSRFLMAMGVPFVQDQWKRTDLCVYLPFDPDEEDPVVDWVFLRVPTEQLNDTIEVATETLARRDKAALSLHALVLPVLLGEEIDRFAAVNWAMFLACLAMGAVVMANLGLVNVLARSREIAIERTEGATRRDIVLQFLVEGLVLSLFGCLLGCGLAMLLAKLRVSLEPVSGFTWVFPWREAGIAVAVALGVGLLAQLLPAFHAARQDPCVGLADE